MASHRGILKRGVAASVDLLYTDGRYPSWEIPDMNNGGQSPSVFREPRTSEHGDRGAQSCVAQTDSLS